MYTYIYIYIHVDQIKTANNAVGELGFFCKSSDAMEWSFFGFTEYNDKCGI